jgi:hypothetical protein
MEIRLPILEMEMIARQKHPGWASLASVCKEWQLVIAPENLRRLELGSSCLGDFGRIMIRQMYLVHLIWLNVELRNYTCRRCELSGIRHQDNCHAFLDVVRKLFSILTEWEPGMSLTLELNAYSPSDSNHWFKGYHLATKAGDDGKDHDETACTGWHDPIHGWSHGQRVNNPPRTAILRLFERIERCFRHHELLHVNVVNCLILRRQLRRRISPLVLRQILERLGSLQHFVYEHWREWQHAWPSQAGLGTSTS